MDEDRNGDGVKLLMAYALDLDPNRNLQNAMPSAELHSNLLSLAFRGTTPRISYIVGASDGLFGRWQLTISGADADDLGTESVRCVSD